MSLETRSSPVSGFTTFSAAICPAILVAKDNFVLYLKRPTFVKSYLLGSKNKAVNRFLAASTEGISPGLNLL